MLASVRPEMPVDSPTFRAAVLLLVGHALSFNVDRMAARTQTPRAFVAACTRRLFDNGVWQADGPVYTWTSPDDTQFWKDVSVAEGLLCRRVDRLGRIEWARAGAWRKHYEFAARESDALAVAYTCESDLPQTKAVEALEIEEPFVPEPPRPRNERPVPALAASAMMPAGNTWLGSKPVGNELFPNAQWLS